MKKINLFIGVALLAASVGFSGVSHAEEAQVVTPQVSASRVATDNVKVKVWGDGVVELPVITEIDYKKGLAEDDRLYGQFGCTAISKKLDNGDMIVGRSMDLYYSHRPVYIIRTNVPGFYKSVGVGYNPFHGQTFEEVKKEGVPKDKMTGHALFSMDIMNEKGLYIESNMRPYEPESETGIKSSSGTNPGAEYRMSFVSLPRFLAERSANVEEAVALARTVDVHSMKTKTIDWCGAIFIADASGHRGLLELVDNKLIWTDGQSGQANYYVNDEYKDKALYGNGYGRFKTVTDGVKAVKSEADMLKLMNKVRYTQLMTPETCEFDPTSEVTSPNAPSMVKFGGKLTAKDAMNPANHDEIISMISKAFADKRRMSLKELQDDGTTWQSVFQLVANCNKKTLRVKFFENPNLVFDFAVNK